MAKDYRVHSLRREGARMRFAFAVSFVSLALCANRVFADVPTRQELDAIREHESLGHGGDFAEGDKIDKKTHLLKPRSEWSLGPYQIGPKCLADYNRWNRTRYINEDCFGNRELSEKICKDYIDHYATEARLGHKPTSADKFGIWNGGPNGWRMKDTEVYRKRVLEILERLTQSPQER
jgi:hypothetical protein